MNIEVIDATLSPSGRMDVLSRAEVAQLLDTSKGSLHQVLRRCLLAVLNSGGFLDDGHELLERYRSFQVSVTQSERGISLQLKNAPAVAFVDGQIIRGINEHLFAVLRDILYVANEITGNPHFDLQSGAGVTDAVFHILRNANVLRPLAEPKLVVCWGGHSIPRHEYDYTKVVGYELGLRGIDICTGCGPGAMKGPMKGAAIGHSKQRITPGRYLGITEPGIIASESPNPIVNDLVIMPDIEKRLEAFVRVAHAIVVFPGGAGTAEEILYLLGILLHPDNAGIPLPLIFTGPAESADYFRQIHAFIGDTLGETAQSRYRIIVGDPEAVAREAVQGLTQVREFREARSDAYFFNWLLKIVREFQTPFIPTHDNMRSLALHRDQPVHQLAAALRCAFSGIVAGNVKEAGIRAVREHGLFELQGDAAVVAPMDALLQAFIAQRRMKLPGREYSPCYRVVR